jgi:hypothetical protein
MVRMQEKTLKNSLWKASSSTKICLERLGRVSTWKGFEKGKRKAILGAWPEIFEAHGLVFWDRLALLQGSSPTGLCAGPIQKFKRKEKWAGWGQLGWLCWPSVHSLWAVVASHPVTRSWASGLAHQEIGSARSRIFGAMGNLRGKKSTLGPSTFVEVRFSSLNSKIGQNTSLNF